MRCGLIAKKLGMTRIWNADGRQVSVTVLSLEDVTVTALRTEEKHGYTAVQLGAGRRKPRRTSKAMQRVFAAAGVEPRQKLAEFRVSPENMLAVGDQLAATHFVAGQYVDVTAVSQGKSFAGSIKRHGFGGGRATHGVSVSHRAHGSTGQNQDPGRVFKGKKMAGHMGNRQVTTQNLQVAESDLENGLVLIDGAVPGPRNGWVLIKDAVKKQAAVDLPLPAQLKEKPAASDTTSSKEEAAPAPEEATADQSAPEAQS